MEAAAASQCRRPAVSRILLEGVWPLVAPAVVAKLHYGESGANDPPVYSRENCGRDEHWRLKMMWCETEEITFACREQTND